ncbi:MAG: PAS domain S-box protein [Leptospirales bacterium]
MVFPTIIGVPGFEANIRLNTYRAMAALGAIVLPLWGWLQYSSGADVHEPPGIRIALSGFCAAFLLASLFSRAFVSRMRPMAIGLYQSITCFAGYLALRNDFSMVTALGMLLVFVVVAAILDSRRELIVYTAGHLIFAAIAPRTVLEPEVSPRLYLISTITVIAFSVAVHVGRLRSEGYRRKAEEELQRVLNHLESEVAARTRDLRDSNERLLSEVASRRRAEKFLHARGKILESLSDGGKIEEMLAQVLRVIEAANQGMLPSIMLLDETGSRLDPVAGPSLPEYYLEALHGLPVGPNSGLCGAAVYYCRSMSAANLQQEDSCRPFREVIERAGLKGCCSVPLIDSTGRALGSFAVYYSTERIPDAIETEFIKSSAHYLAAAIERYRTQEELELSRTRYRLATGAARVGVWDLNIAKMELYIDPMFKEILGYQDTPDVHIPLKMIRLVLPDPDRRALMKAARTNLGRRSRALAIEHRARCRNGELVWLSTRGAAIRDERGRPVRLMGTGTDITEFKTTERALQENEAKFRSLSEAAFEGLLVLNGTEVVDANEKFHEMFEWRAGEVAGRRITDFVAPESAEKLCACLESLSCGVMEFVAVRRSGGSFPVEINASRFSQAGAELRVVAFRDLTERRRLESMTLQLDRFVENANGPIFCVDAKGGVMEWNASIARLTGRARSEMLGQPIIDACVAPEDRAGVAAMLARVRQGEAVANFEFSLVGARGRSSRVLMNASAGPDRSGALAAVWCVGQDITELSKYRSVLEKKVRERTRDLLSSLEKEKAIGDLRARFVAMASHEFRTPLATIQSTADVLLQYSDRIDEAKSSEYLSSILSEVVHMTELLDDILIFGQADAGKFIFRPEPLDAGALCEELIEKFERCPGNANRFEWSCEIESRPSLDEKMVRLILSNLISNALKYSPADETIEIRVRSDRRGASIEIRDRGIGIAEEDRAHLFSPFHRGANVGNRSGTGLGLAIIKMAVEMHSGTIELDTRENIGTRIQVSLPHVSEGVGAASAVVAK